MSIPIRTHMLACLWTAGCYNAKKATLGIAAFMKENICLNNRCGDYLILNAR